MQGDVSCRGGGHGAVFTELRVAGGKRRRVMVLGFFPGETVMALQRAPFGGTVSYEIMGTVVALRSSDARRIGICRESEANR